VLKKINSFTIIFYDNLEFAYRQNSSKSLKFANYFELEINRNYIFYNKYKYLIQDSSCVFLPLTKQKCLLESQTNFYGIGYLPVNIARISH